GHILTLLESGLFRISAQFTCLAGTIRKMFHIQACEYAHFLLRHGRPFRWNAVSAFTHISTNRQGKIPGWKRWSARTPRILIMTGMSASPLSAMHPTALLAFWTKPATYGGS